MWRKPVREEFVEYFLKKWHQASSLECIIGNYFPFFSNKTCCGYCPIVGRPDLCENGLEEVQGTTASSHIPPPLLQDPWQCIQLLCAELHPPCQWNFTINQAALAAQWQGQDQTDLQYQARGCGDSKVKPATGKAWAWVPGFHFEIEKALLVRACGAS